METACTLLSSMNSSIQLGNTHLVGLDPNYDKTSLYPDMVISYRWLDNLQEYSSVAYQAMQSKFTKKNTLSKNRQRNRYNIHNISLTNIDYLVSAFQRTFEMQIDILRPFGVFTILNIELERTLKAIIVLRGFVIEWVLVKGFDETFDEICLLKKEKKLKLQFNNNHMNNMKDFDDTIDIWTPSQHPLFRTITEHANAAILHFYAPFQMESAIKAYLVIRKVSY